MSLVIRSVAGEPFSESAVGRDGVPRGGVGPSHLHKRCHSILFAGRLAGVRGWVGQAGGCAARRQVRIPTQTGHQSDLKSDSVPIQSGQRSD
jgi:hypothetical protein